MPAEPAGQPLEPRLDLGGRSLRKHAARGVLINSGFKIGLAGIGFLQRFALAAFLTQEEFGLWGVLITTIMTIAWLKDVGIADKFIQQSEPDQELAYQRAFTIELCLSLAFFVLLSATLPLYALAYGRSDIIVPGIVLASAVVVMVFETPIWIAYRRMQFVRQRVLAAVNPVTSTVAMIALAATGAGVWSLVLGILIGALAGAVVAVTTSPHKPRWRFDRDTLKEYAAFSWPLLGWQGSNMVVVQGVILISSWSVGIEGVGVITLAASITVLAERVDQIVSETLYPAVCAVVDRIDVVYEAFVTSNRIAVMWAMPFGVALGLFAGDLVDYVFGERWEPAVGVVAAMGVLAGFRQIGFNWAVFMRAMNRTRPIFYNGIINIASFFLIIAPCILAFGLTGYVVGMGISLVVQIVARGHFLRQLFPQFRLMPYVVRAVAPVAPGTALILLGRALNGERSVGRAIAELAVFALVTTLAMWLSERKMIMEMLGYLRGEGGLRSRQATT